MEVRALIETLIARCRPHAEQLGCATELDQVSRLATANGAHAQREWAAKAGAGAAVSMLCERFTSSSARAR